jgi:hypothetical protein
LAVGTDRTGDIREKKLISKIYYIIFPFFKDLAVLAARSRFKRRGHKKKYAAEE